MKHLKMLGIAVMATLALTAVVASAASAANFQSAKYPATITASQEGEHIFTIEGGLTTKCKKATFTGTLAAASEALLVTPTYTECTSFGLASTIAVNGCHYVNTTNGIVHIIVTTPPCSITVNTATCEVRISTQSRSTVSYTNNAGGTVTIHVNVSKIKYDKTKDGFLCPLNGTGEKEDGTYTGSTLASGNNGAIKVE